MSTGALPLASPADLPCSGCLSLDNLSSPSHTHTPEPQAAAGMPAELLFGAFDPLAVFLDGGHTSALPQAPTIPGVPSMPAMPPVPMPAVSLAGIGEGSSGELSLPGIGLGGPATASSGGSGGTPSGGSGGTGLAMPAAPVTSAGAPRTKAGGKGGRKELSEDQKERIKAKNRRWALGQAPGGCWGRGQAGAGAASKGQAGSSMWQGPATGGQQHLPQR